MQKVFDKTYCIGADQLRVKLKYNLIYTDHELDMDVLSVGNLEYGYEDEDNLTYYPNVFKLEFDDPDRKNYHTLKFATGETPYGNYEDNHSGEIFFNGKAIYAGYIDKESLEYSEEKRTITFELVDYSIQLKQKNIDGARQDWAGGIADIILLWRTIYPGLAFNVTNDFEEYKRPLFNGVYFKHNWIFRGNGTIGVPEFNVDWGAEDGWNHVHIFRQKLYEKSGTIMDLLKNYAREFGMIIGTDGVNKVNITKRFVSPLSVNTINITDKLINYSSAIYLKNIKGVRNIPSNNPNPPNNVIIEGTVETVDGTNYGKAVDQDSIIDLTTILSRQQGTGNTGLANIRVSQGSYVQTVLNGIDDPDLNPRQYRSIESIVTRYTFFSRVRPRDKYELELEGIDYKLYEYYLITLPGIPSAVLRPLQISTDLINNKTTMQALEVTL